MKTRDSATGSEDTRAAADMLRILSAEYRRPVQSNAEILGRLRSA
ncbi:MAG TPA: hypothetical protein VJ617_07470 [Arthrobacter sp.]|nr:hypothetical protein [Arthrobacter sp.]